MIDDLVTRACSLTFSHLPTGNLPYWSADTLVLLICLHKQGLAITKRAENHKKEKKNTYLINEELL